jgi:hypothetical protein
MKKIFLISLITLANPSFAGNWTEYNTYNGGTIVRPFGFPNRQPPTLRTVKLVDFQLGLDAQQTCGYTDWTTAQLMIPKKLLTKEYWKNVGNQTVQRAKEAVAALSGALPSMLACNVSPTFCHILNHAELMATAEAQLTFDTCQMLDGIGNVSMLQSEGLRQCIMKATSRGIPAGEAREYCLVNDNNPYGSKSSQANETSKKSGEGWSIDKLFADMFPDKVKTRDGIHIPLNNAGHRYSRRVQSLRFAKELFAGIEVNGGATIRRGGTFQPSVDEDLAQEMNDLEREIILVLKEMIKYQDKGFSKNDIISKTEKLWSNKEEWAKNGAPHPFFRATSDGTEPTMLVTPEQVLLLAPLVDRGKPDFLSHELKQVISRLSRSVAHIKVQDKISDLYTRAIDACTKPDHQSAIAQKNCEIIKEKARLGLEIAQIKQESETKAIVAQREISELVEGIQRSRLRNQGGHTAPLPLINNNEMRMPWQ